MSFDTEFSTDYIIHDRIREFIASGKLKDQSHHDDDCPSFGFTKKSMIVLFVDHPDKNKREDLYDLQFSIISYYLDPNGPNMLLETDDVDEVIRFIETF